MPKKRPPIAAANFNLKDANLKSLPWGLPPESWLKKCHFLIELPLGISRHPVFVIKCSGYLLAIKEMPAGEALKEFALLEQIDRLRIPAVKPAGTVQLAPADLERSYLITHYLDRSLPYRLLFMSQTLEETRSHLLDAMASLLVQLHIAGIYWGDCSLSNTLFRRDAGALVAYLVDAESVEVHTPFLSPAMRYQDLQRMEANIISEMIELAEIGYKHSSEVIYDTGFSIRQRYHQLWDELTRREIILSEERYRIQERIRVLNNLGYSIGDLNLTPTDGGNMLWLRIIVAGRNFHRDQLFELTGLEAEEMQARKLVNEIREFKALLSQQRNEDVLIGAASFYWLQNIYTPVIKRLQSLIDLRHNRPVSTLNEIDTEFAKTMKAISLESALLDPVELYCQVLEHKWYLSEQAKHDVGHIAAAENYVKYMTSQDLHDHES
jgi:hypothetical protein